MRKLGTREMGKGKKGKEEKERGKGKPGTWKMTTGNEGNGGR